MKLFAASTVVATCLLSGCGGSGSGNGSMREASIDISWAAQSRTFSGPASAQSAMVEIVNTDDFGVTPLVVAVNRPSALGAIDQTYQVATNAVPGPGGISVTFYSEPYGQGSVLGTAGSGGELTSQGTFLGPNGQPLGPIVTVGPLASLSVSTFGLSVNVGGTTYLHFNGYDANGNLYATEPGLGVWAQQSTACSTLTPNGTLVGTAPGTTTVTVTYKGITSPPATVTIQ